MKRSSVRRAWSTLLGLAGAALELAFAGYCLHAAALAGAGGGGFALFEAWVLVTVELAGLAAQRVVWLVGDAAARPTRGSLMAVGFSTIGLVVSAPAVVVLLLLAIVVFPRSGAMWVGMLLRRVVWAWLGRARTPAQHAALRGYGKRTAVAQVFSMGLAALGVWLAAPRFGGLEQAAASGALVAAGAGIYFALLAVVELAEVIVTARGP